MYPFLDDGVGVYSFCGPFKFEHATRSLRVVPSTRGWARISIDILQALKVLMTSTTPSPTIDFCYETSGDDVCRRASPRDSFPSVMAPVFVAMPVRYVMVVWMIIRFQTALWFT